MIRCDYCGKVIDTKGEYIESPKGIAVVRGGEIVGHTTVQENHHMECFRTENTLCRPLTKRAIHALERTLQYLEHIAPVR